ncbi:NAD(P)-dependent oxidoreductase [Myroides sp. LJL110]
MKVLINHSASPKVVENLQQAGLEVLQVRVAIQQLVSYTKNNQIDILVVGKATGFTKQVIDELSHLKAIVFASSFVELEIIDYIKTTAIQVIWPETSLSNATAELVFAHLLCACRFLQESNRNMPLEGDTSFKFLQESYQNGIELAGKTLGIIGMNLAGELVAQKALALGMHVLYHDTIIKDLNKTFTLANGMEFKVNLKSSDKQTVLQQSHFISVHTRFFERYVIDQQDLQQAKNLLGLINCAYPQAVNEVDLVETINQEQILFAALDRFEEEPTPAIQVLMQPGFSLSPYINGSTQTSQVNLWEEIVEKMLELLDK